MKCLLISTLVYLQVPFQEAVKSVLDQLKALNNAGLIMHVPKASEERSFRTFTFAAVKLPQKEVSKALEAVSGAYELSSSLLSS